MCSIPPQESDYPAHDQIDLYDDVISPSANNNGDAPEDRDYLDNLPPPAGSEGNKSTPPNVVYTYTGKRIALYIGNLTWVGYGFGLERLLNNKDEYKRASYSDPDEAYLRR